MACFYPLSAYQNTASKAVFFSELRKHGDAYIALQLPCGQCVGCRLERSRQWAMRCMHEASLYDENCFITLTYADEYLPFRNQLEYAVFQRFLKRLRKRVCRKVRYFACGEYGETLGRPHYHALIFGYDFPDKERVRVLDSGCKVYNSALLDELWPFGHTSVGSLTFESAAYVARYSMKKMNGPMKEEHYRRFDEFGEYQQTPEFGHMSLKPGIGEPWLRRFRSDVYPNDYVVVNGVETKPPKYYDRLYARDEEADMEYIKFERMMDAMTEHSTPERLAVREEVARARISFKKRSL